MAGRQRPGIDDAVDSRNHILLAFDQLGHGRAIQGAPSVYMPERIPVRRIKGKDVARRITGEEKMAGGSKNAGEAMSGTELSLPDRFPVS